MQEAAAAALAVREQYRELELLSCLLFVDSGTYLEVDLNIHTLQTRSAGPYHSS